MTPTTKTTFQTKILVKSAGGLMKFFLGGEKNKQLPRVR